MTSPGRTRDPEQKIHAIGQAAAELIAESGASSLTHRAVAARAGVAVGTTTRYFATIDDLRRHALEYLATAVADDLDEIRQGLEEASDPIAFLTLATAEGLADRKAVLAECSLAYAGLFADDLRELSLRWFTGLSETLTPYFGRSRSELLAMSLDGVAMNTALSGTPPSTDLIEAAIRAITTMPIPDTTGEDHTA